MKSALCRKVQLFADGALKPEEAQAFREHLPTCPECSQELMDLAHLHVLETRYIQKNPGGRTSTGPAGPVGQVLTHPRWQKAAAVVGLAIAAGLTVTLWTSLQNRVASGEFYPAGGERLVAGRSSYEKAGDYRPMKQATLGPSGALGLSRDVMARLDKAGDRRGLAAYLLARGSDHAEEALADLSDLPATPEVLSERAYAYLVRGGEEQRDFEEALRQADAALALQPDFAPALWNRAVALEGLHLSRAAAAQFKAIAAKGQPGWSQEAKERAARLEAAVEKAEAAWKTALDAGKRLVKDGTAPEGDSVRGAQVFRAMFYEAVRVRTSKEEVLKLLKVAQELDGLAGSSALAAFVQQIASRDFRVRAPLAEAYGHVYGQDGAVRPEDLLERLRNAGQPDLLLAVLARLDRAGSASARLPASELERLVAATEGDPWHHALATKLYAEALQKQGDDKKSREVLESALEPCYRAGVDYRCIELAVDLGYAHDRGTDLEPGLKVARKGWEAADRMNDPGTAVRFILLLAEMTRLREDASLARAYYEEGLERRKSAPEFERYVHEGVALLDVHQQRFDEAREHLDLAIKTQKPLGLTGALALSDLGRERPSAADDGAMERFREKRSGVSSGRGEQALAEEAYGRWLLGHPRRRSEGLEHLRSAIRMATAGDLALSDPYARRALSYSYTELILDAGKRGDGGEALSLFEEERGGQKLALPSRCLLAVTADGPRTLAVLRQADGSARVAYYDEHRAGPLPERLTQLLPADARAFPGCDTVGVLARAPVYGRAGLLPKDVAWSYLGAGPAAGAGEATGGSHLVVQQVSPLVMPPWVREKLRTPERWEAEEGVAELTGDQATPGEVLRRMEDAGDITVVAHAVTNPDSDESVLLLAPEAGGKGRNTLSASDLRGVRLRRRPLVFLASCKGALPAPVLHEARSLPAAFIQAGARAVLAASDRIPERDGPRFFTGVRKRILAGAAPAVALRDERAAWEAGGQGAPWLDGVLLFE
jgi:tetratricopeptide (TPR) repeat protein